MSFLHGGSEAEDKAFSGNPFGGFFHQGVESIDFSIKKTYTVRLLPAFDYTINRGDPSFKEGFTSYRDNSTKQDYHTKTPGFSPWYFIVSGYTFFGKGKKKFLSPLTGGPANRPGVDPVRDCYDYIKKNRLQHLQHLTDNDPTKRESPYLAPARRFVISNALVANEETNEPENKLVVYTEACLRDLKVKLSWRAGRGDPEITPAWPDYLYGDITDPETGSLATVKECKFDTFSTCAFYYSSRPQTLDGFKKFPIDLKTEEGKAFLTNRYDISDLENVTLIWTYEDILDLLIDDGVVPYDVIQTACSPYANVPAAPTRPAPQTTMPGATVPPAQVQQEPTGFGNTGMGTPAPAKTASVGMTMGATATATATETGTVPMTMGTGAAPVATAPAQPETPVHPATPTPEREEEDNIDIDDPEYNEFLELKDKITKGEYKTPDVVRYGQLSQKFGNK